jgi:DNA-binding FadR family transcriptional regulator
MAKPALMAEQVAELIADRIRSGEIHPGAWLDSERRLAETHQVGRNTVRRALQILAEAGLIEQTPSGHRVRAAAAEPSAPGVVTLDAAAVQSELAAIRAELHEITERLGVIEARTGAADGAGG